jgi:hypothetical protein
MLQSPGDGGRTDPRARLELSRRAGFRALDRSLPFADVLVDWPGVAGLFINVAVEGLESAGTDRVPGGVCTATARPMSALCIPGCCGEPFADTA